MIYIFGTKDCKAEQLVDFLKHNTCETLFLVGDIIDGWKISSNRLFWKQSHTDVITKILKLSQSNCRVIYIAGNHDEFLRPIIHYNVKIGSIEIYNQYSYPGIDGNRYLIIHGDLFDGISKLAPWLSFLGDRMYDLILSLNSKVNWIGHKFGFRYWSLSKYLKQKVKSATSFIFQFEKNLAEYCKKRGFDGVICGHIHHPAINDINGVIYMNDGDWVESMSALAEHHSGKWEIVYGH